MAVNDHDPGLPAFWERSWARTSSVSFLARTQRENPDRWRVFYDETGETDPATWNALSGHGEAIAALFSREGLISTGGTVLDVGCGTGVLALALAGMGARVTALDDSPGMIAALSREIRTKRLDGLVPVVGRFESHVPPHPFDLVVASCFPPALSASGLTRLESWSARHVAVVLGAGNDIFPFRRRLWETIMRTSMPSGKDHLIHLMGYLLASGRQPELHHMAWPALLDRPVGDMTRFFTRYFRIFGKDDPETVAAVNRHFASLAVDGRIRAEGRGGAAVVWWRRKADD